jgi:hypothetical protein
LKDYRVSAQRQFERILIGIPVAQGVRRVAVVEVQEG